jgi:hypothetical protein
MAEHDDLSTMRESAREQFDIGALLQVTTKEKRDDHVNDADKEFEGT